jgi:hypothetical protein
MKSSISEINLLESIQVRLSLAGLSDDGCLFRIRSEFYRADGKLCLWVTSLGGWPTFRPQVDLSAAIPMGCIARTAEDG